MILGGNERYHKVSQQASTKKTMKWGCPLFASIPANKRFTSYCNPNEEASPASDRSIMTAQIYVRLFDSFRVTTVSCHPAASVANANT
jgi:hypothetical protein